MYYSRKLGGDVPPPPPNVHIGGGGGGPAPPMEPPLKVCMIVSTLQISVDEFKQFLLLQDFDNSLVSCGMDITKRMERMESQLR